jgi:long-chain acyl-CoA synthetase
MVETLAQMVLNTVRAYPKDEFMLHKVEGVYCPISTAEFGERVKGFCLGLKELGHKRGDKLIILSENRPEWVMSDLANLCGGGVTVPIYTTLVPEAVKYIIQNSDARFVVVSNEEQWAKIKAVKKDLRKVRHFISMAAQPPAGVLGWQDVLDKGARRARKKGKTDEFEKLVAHAKPQDEASIIYTSGTTGIPKGVILTHNNFLSNVMTCVPLVDITCRDTVLSFLPLSHVLERMVMFCYTYVGATIAFAESVEAVAQNLLEVKPHIMVSVPRVFEKIYARVMDQVLAGSGLKRKIFFWALKIGKDWSRRRLDKEPIPALLERKRELAHKLVFSKIIAKTGGRVRFFLSGGAPLSKDIAEFFHAIGLIILEGYGLTETSPVISLNTFEGMRFGAVGKPIPGVEVKIAQDGEILTRGPHVMKGYYRMPAATREVMAKGGWFKTGDIGHFDPDGFLVITDRKKDLIITSGGKNIAPQPIENILKTVPYISNAVVVGDGKKFVSALIVPDFEKLEVWAKRSGIAYGSRAELVRNERIVAFLAGEVDKATPGLASYERIKQVALLDRDFEIETGEITPTLKVKRNIVERKYKDLIASLYKGKDENG